MSNLIDINELIDYFCQKDCGFNPKDCALFPCHEIEIIKNAPSVQPELSNNSPKLDSENGELISREEAIKAVKFYETFCDPYPRVIEALEELPSAQQERKTGRWVERNPQNSPDCRLIECSECGNAYIVGYNINYDDWIDGRNFCMKCGADLRGGSNGKST